MKQTKLVSEILLKQNKFYLFILFNIFVFKLFYMNKQFRSLYKIFAFLENYTLNFKLKVKHCIINLNVLIETL